MQRKAEKQKVYKAHNPYIGLKTRGRRGKMARLVNFINDMRPGGFITKKRAL